MMFSKEDLEAYEETHDRFILEALRVFNRSREIEGKSPIKGRTRLVTAEIEGHNIYITFQFYCGDVETYIFPARYMYDENWENILREKLERGEVQ